MKIAPVKTNIIKPIAFGIKINGKEGSFEDLYDILGFNQTEKTKTSSVDHRKPNIIGVNREYYVFDIAEGKEIPVSNRIFKKETPRGQRMYCELMDGRLIPYSHFERKTYKGEVVEETLYHEGYPFLIHEYKDGKEFKETTYSMITKRREEVRFLDNSFELKSGLKENGTSIKLKEKSNSVYISAPKENGKGIISFNENAYISWDRNEDKVENIKIDFITPKKAIKMLKHLQDVIYSPEYKNDFGKTGYLNVQLRDIIRHLEKKSK